MMALGAVASLVVMAGWLFLNWRALQSHGLTFEQKAAMAAGWAVIIAGLAFVLTRMGN
ncbi:MAG: hypothetical protein ABIM50_01960 [Novosphingobium sp.]